MPKSRLDHEEREIMKAIERDEYVPVGGKELRAHQEVLTVKRYPLPDVSFRGHSQGRCNGLKSLYP